MTTKAQKMTFLSTAYARFGEVVTRQQLLSLEQELGESHSWARQTSNSAGRGKYRLPIEKLTGVAALAAVPKIVESVVIPMNQAPKAAAKIATVARYTENAVIPQKDPLFVEFGFFSKMKMLLKSMQFYPVFVSGLSGNGKTMMVEQACADLGREYLRVNISSETGEDDLIGGFRLVDGETRWYDGPVIQAMKAGAVLCLDEIDRGTNKLMCLQAILEGKPYLIKKTGEYVEPKSGFNIVATANTKGKGDDSGRFMAAMILDDAFLERFPITVEQEYPDVKIETKILARVFDSLGIKDNTFAENLVKWADIIRKTFQEGAIDEIIATRRLVHIAKAYKIFGDRTAAIEYCINRFDSETKTAFLDLYSKIDAGEEKPADKTAEDERPF